MTNEAIKAAADIISTAKHCVVFTGAGISVESGIPPFRGQGGLWERYDPSFIEIDNFYRDPMKCWLQIKKIFYDFMGKAEPNAAHMAIAELEQSGYIKEVITQNIDNLHQMAGSSRVYEFHGNTRNLLCVECGKYYSVNTEILSHLPPICSNCSGLLKPDFIFFGEGIPEEAYQRSFKAAEACDVMLVIGTTGEVMPAGMLPQAAKRRGARIIEINTEESSYTGYITDIFLNGKAGEVMSLIREQILKQ